MRKTAFIIAAFVLVTGGAQARKGPSKREQRKAIAAYKKGHDYYGPPMVAHDARCYPNGPISEWYHTVPLFGTAAKMTITHSGWCGNRRRITSGGLNYNFKSDFNYPYCETGASSKKGEDGTPRWTHAGMWSTTGVYTVAFVCLPILGSQHINLRVASNGYWDRFDDFGF